MRKRISALAMLLFLTGCWDRIEIEERGFVVGTAIDAGDSGDYLLTFQFAVPAAMQATTDSSSGSGQGGKSYHNVSVEGRTLFKATRRMSDEVSRPPYLEHNKIIIISERVARAGKVEEVLDLFIRDPEMRRAARVMVAVGEAREMLDAKPLFEKLPVEYINSTSENPDKSESILPPTNIGQLHRYLLEEHSYSIPKVTKQNGMVKLNGAAVFNVDNRLKGFLNAEETSGRNFFSGTLKAGALELLIDDKPVVFEVKKANRKIRANVTDRENPVFDVDVAIEGNVGESYTKANVLESRMISAIEEKAAEKVKSIMNGALVKAQRDYKSDILGFSDNLNENHYHVWKALKNDWDKGKCLFSRARVNIHVKAKLRIIGAIEKAKP